jgi:hypothetical protein
MGRVKRSEPSERHKIALGKEGVRKPKIKLVDFHFRAAQECHAKGVKLENNERE